MKTSRKPILVAMTWRGEARFERCLASIENSMDHFSRVVISVTSTPDSPDMTAALEFAARHPDVEVICTGRELPTLQHQAFWVGHLERTGAHPDDWIFWLAYDDEIRARGLQAILDPSGNWPLERGTAYFGPWAMRHEQADRLFDGPWAEPLESWTSFPPGGSITMPVLDWIRGQLEQPTYIQMSGSVCPSESYLALRDLRPRKTGPMRIEMATAAAPPTTHVAEFSEPVTIIYGRPNSDRASYGRSARREDLHLIAWLAWYSGRRPSNWGSLLGLAGGVTRRYARALRRGSPHEEWRVRGRVAP